MSTGIPTFNIPPQPNAQQPQGGAPEAQAPQPGQGMQGPAPAIMRLLGAWHRVAGEIGQHHPQIASQMNKVADATQQALVLLARETTQRQQGQGLPTDQSAQPSAAPQTGQPQANPQQG
jgi:hypothetical protein